MSAKAGINKFEEKAVEAMEKEFRQIDKGPMEGKPLITPIDPDTLSFEEKNQEKHLI